jgi:hypothetical protein
MCNRELIYQCIGMASKPNGKKRTRQADFLASFSGPRIRPNPLTFTRIDRNEDGLKIEECFPPVPVHTQSPIFRLLEPLEHETDPIDALLDGAEEGEEETVTVNGDAKKTTQVR